MKLTETTQDIEKVNIGEVHQGRIKASSKAFRVLSSTLYSDKPRAIVRELSTNARDAHTMVGKQAIPFEVSLPSHVEPQFSIRDFGPGLAEDQVYNLFMTYFESTKTESNDFNGQLGLGCKSPYSYTSTFTVVSRQGGIKKTYACFMDESFIPSVTKLMTEESLEADGLEILIQVHQNDIEAFTRAAAIVYKYFDVKPKIVNYDHFDFAVVEPTLFEIDNVRLTNSDVETYRNVVDNSSKRHNVTMGYVNYPIDYTTICNTIKDYIVKRIADQNSAWTYDDIRAGLSDLANNHMAISIDAPIGSVDFAPSREALSYDKQTCVYLYEQAEKILNVINAEYQAVFANVQKLWEGIAKAQDVFADLAKAKVGESSTQYGTYINTYRRVLSSLKNRITIDGVEIRPGLKTISIAPSTVPELAGVAVTTYHAKQGSVTSVLSDGSRYPANISNLVRGKDSNFKYAQYLLNAGVKDIKVDKAVFVIDDLTERDNAGVVKTKLKLLMQEGFNPKTGTEAFAKRYNIVYVIHAANRKPDGSYTPEGFDVSKPVRELVIPAQPINADVAIAWLDAMGAPYVRLSEIQTRSLLQIQANTAIKGTTSKVPKAFEGKTIVTCSLGKARNITRTLASDIEWEDGGFYLPTSVSSALSYTGSHSSEYHISVINDFVTMTPSAANKVVYCIPSSATSKLNSKWVNIYDVVFEAKHKELKDLLATHHSVQLYVPYANAKALGNSIRYNSTCSDDEFDDAFATGTEYLLMEHWNEIKHLFVDLKAEAGEFFDNYSAEINTAIETLSQTSPVSSYGFMHNVRVGSEPEMKRLNKLVDPATYDVWDKLKVELTAISTDCFSWHYSTKVLNRNHTACKLVNPQFQLIKNVFARGEDSLGRDLEEFVQDQAAGKPTDKSHFITTWVPLLTILWNNVDFSNI